MTIALPDGFDGTTPARTWPNPFEDPEAFISRVAIAGIEVLAYLIKFNGIKVEDAWKAQKSKETSGQTNVFNGTKNVGGEKGFDLTFRAFDLASFAQLEDIWNALAPVLGLGSATTAPAASSSAAPTSAIGSPPASAEALIAQAQASLAALSNPSSAQQSATNDKGPSTSTSASSEPSPGPRPPTVLIENGLLQIMGILAVARASWAWEIGPGNSWDVTIGLIQDKPPTPAGVGAQAPAFVSFATTPGAGFAGASASASAAQQSAAGT